MYNTKITGDKSIAGDAIEPQNIIESTRDNLKSLRNMVRAYMRDNNKLTLQGPYIRQTMLTDQMAEPYGSVE